MSDIKTLNEKIDKMIDDVNEIKVDLALHMQRSKLNEENMIMIREEFKMMKTEFKPVKLHVDMMNLVAKIIVVCGGVLLFFQQMGWLETILRLFLP